MSAVQLSFSLRVSSGVKTVHLLGSWDGYVGQLPLSKDKSSSKSGSWKGTFRFQNSTLEAGQRYWYYYIIDGYHVAHNPSVTSTIEPTTGLDIPKGRPLSISQIQAPKPMSPHATKHILDASYYDNEELEELADRFGSANIEDEFITDFSTSPISSSGSSLSYRSDSSSPNSSLSGYSTPGSDVSSCTCERYGITRKGERVKLDCGGSRCGYDDDSDSICSSGSEDEYEYEASVSRTSSRRHGVVA
ncbi:hypothetical protein FOFC_16695 [Fusarium oxysporum]|nr:hypothetical protein FOFC_16695 [Fusarium oxysporum]